jgi:uncharacterized protein (DUF302 family)
MNRTTRRGFLAAAAATGATYPAASRAAPVALAAQPGWVVLPTTWPFADLVARSEAAIARHGMNLVNAASASEGAKAQGIVIPGNRVLGVFRNDFARRLLAVSVPAGIEAPVRLYLTENTEGVATLSYRTPTAVFAPYAADAGPALQALAAKLDAIFDAIARDAAGPA